MVNRETHHNRKIAVVILAAGEGTRMGRHPKCLIKIDHQPIILKQLQTLKVFGVDDITVVTGFYHEQIEPVIASDTALQVVRNPTPEQGQQSSVRLGLQHVNKKADLILIALADQPLVDVRDLNELLEAYALSPANTKILYPVVNHQRGNPVLMTGDTVHQFLNDESGITCRQFIDRQASTTHQYQTQNNHFITDLDSPEDLTALMTQTGLNITL